MDLDRFKQDVGQGWKWLAEGWRHISDKAANALTYFTPSKDETEVGVRWGLLAADVTADGNRVLVEVEVPGLDKEDIDIDVEDRRLVITGRKSYESERTEGSMVISERAFGHFQRVIPLPDDVSVEKAEARYKSGVLTVKLPKSAPPQSRKIKVTSG